MPTYTIHEAKTHLSKLIAAMERGEEVVIARGAKPVARLTAVTAAADEGLEERVPIPADQPGWRIGADGKVELLYTGRRAGALKGLFKLEESFFDPMPEDELALWEGGSSDFEGR